MVNNLTISLKQKTDMSNKKGGKVKNKALKFKYRKIIIYNLPLKSQKSNILLIPSRNVCFFILNEICKFIEYKGRLIIKFSFQRNLQQFGLETLKLL